MTTATVEKNTKYIQKSKIVLAQDRLNNTLVQVTSNHYSFPLTIVLPKSKYTHLLQVLIEYCLPKVNSLITLNELANNTYRMSIVLNHEQHNLTVKTLEHNILQKELLALVKTIMAKKITIVSKDNKIFNEIVSLISDKKLEKLFIQFTLEKSICLENSFCIIIDNFSIDYFVHENNKTILHITTLAEILSLEQKNLSIN